MSKQNQIKKALHFEQQRKRDLAAGRLDQVRASYDQQDVFLDDGNSPEFWDRHFHQQAATGNSEFACQFPMEAWRILQVLRYLDVQQSILNLGVGAGRLEARLLPKLASSKLYLGTDMTQETLTRLKKRWPKFRFIEADLLKLPIPDQQFTQLCLLEVLEHISPRYTFQVLAEIYRVLKPGGRLFLSVPLNEGLEDMLPNNPNYHLRLYSIDLIEFELKEAGFQIQHTLTASAFAKLFWLKQGLNQLFTLREPNNCLLIAQKV